MDGAAFLTNSHLQCYDYAGNFWWNALDNYGSLGGKRVSQRLLFFYSLEIWKMKQFLFFFGGGGGQKLDLLFFRGELP